MTGIKKMPKLEAYNEPSLGDAVVSVAGRDKGRVLAVIEVLKSPYVLIADGESRKLGNMKLKKTLHLRKIGVLQAFGTDSELKESLEEFKFDFSFLKARHYKPKG